MRKRTTKKINNKAKALLIDWVKSLVSEKEQDQITKQNFMEMLPKEEYIESNRTFYTAFYTYRWAKQSIKKLLRLGKSLDNISIGDLEWVTKRSMKTNQSSIL